MNHLVLIIALVSILSVNSFQFQCKIAGNQRHAAFSRLHANHGPKSIMIPSRPLENFVRAQRLAFHALLLTSCLSLAPTFAYADATASTVKPSTTRAIDLNVNEPKITKTCWLDLKLDTVENGQLERVDIGLYGETMPITTSNFEALATNELGFGYKGSDIFRVITDFSVQGGNINKNANTLPSQRGKEGKAAISETQTSFPVENYDIQHSYVRAGVISMMKDIKGQQDSRFFITLSPQAGWADNRYSAFGRVTKGMTTIAGLQALEVTPPSNFPSPRVMIEDSGCYQ